MSKKAAKEPRLSLQGMRVLAVFIEHQYEDLAGSNIADVTGLPSGTLYPILARFEQAKWLRSKWEDVDPSAEGRPRRRLYRLTATGLVKASAALSPFGQGETA